MGPALTKNRPHVMIFSNYAIGMFETEIPSRKFRLKKENNLHYYRTQRFLTLLCQKARKQRTNMFVVFS